ncbi:MAG TPA: MBL fold metallo-hydrolase, partial [Halomonas sp.]|nr:MBL fold metallo-hydrolase [Halomonas sp.]
MSNENVAQSVVSPIVTHFFDEPTYIFSYVVQDPNSKACAILDSVLDFDYAAGLTDVRYADEIIAFIKTEGFSVEWILETHVHADHLSAVPYLHDTLGGKTGIGDKIIEVQEIFGKAFNASTEFA